MSTRPNGGPPPSVARKRAAVTLPPSPYERLWKRHQVEALEQRASVLVGYRALGDGRCPASRIGCWPISPRSRSP